MTVRVSDEQARAMGIGHLIPKGVARPRGPNKTEARYAMRLDRLKDVGAIRGYWLEAVKFRLADKCWFCPDYLIELPDRSKILHEVKGGFVREDAWVKLKVAADLMPFPFFLAQWVGGDWEITRIGG